MSEGSGARVLLTREQIAERLGVTESKLRPYADAAPAEYWGAETVRGRRAYPPEAEDKFREAIRVPPSVFRQQVAENGGGALTHRVGDSLTQQHAFALIQAMEQVVGGLGTITERMAATQRLIDSVSRAALPPPDDALLDRKEAATLLKCAEASVGRYVKPFRSRPVAVWRRSDCLRYIQTGERQTGKPTQ